MTDPRAPLPEDEKFPSLAPRDKLVLLVVFAVAIGGVVLVVAFWDAFLSTVRR